LRRVQAHGPRQRDAYAVDQFVLWARAQAIEGAIVKTGNALPRILQPQRLRLDLDEVDESLPRVEHMLERGKVDDPDAEFGKWGHASVPRSPEPVALDVELLVDQEAALQIPPDVPAGATGHAPQPSEDVLLYLLE